MTEHQLPVEIEEFSRTLRELAGLLDPASGWYGVFAARDPQGLRACFDGIEILPWDVVEALLQDLAGLRAEGEVAALRVRARALHAEAAAVHDRRPGGRAALGERLALMEGERDRAARRAGELAALLAAAVPDADKTGLTHDLAWAHDDQARATARVAELRSRLTALDREPGEPGVGGPTGLGSAAGHGARNPAGQDPSGVDWHTDLGPAAGPEAGPAGQSLPGVREPTGLGPAAEPVAPNPAGQDPDEGPQPGVQGRPRWVRSRLAAPRRPRGARYAGIEEAEAPGTGHGVAAVPVGGGAPRGARFGGAEEARPEPVVPERPSPEDREAAARTVDALRRLRAEGRGGEAHALLCEAAARPPGTLGPLAEELHRAGLGADWATLLWEASSLPPERFAAAAGVLADAGRAEDCGQLLRQGISRAPDEIGAAALALNTGGHSREARLLLTAVVQARSAEDAARLAAADPHRLVPQLLDAARAVSPARERDLVHALRARGLVGG
ncbi:hypothetical protein [Streptomyces purpureus]|uniref:hypothetical protein n=1 Tax=Streptomyces purpureus TaxID=1951 RepID=UPI0003A0BE9B|nr:hypothetical protein [Streptomyces purpureus]